MKRLLLLSALASPAPALASDVTLSGVVVNACILSTTAGTIVSSGDGRTLSSQGAGGAAATLSVTATGGIPTLNFSAPTATTPAGFLGLAVPLISYSSTGGIVQALTGSPSTKLLNGLLDLVTVHGQITSSTGFRSGAYGVRTTVTCEQP